jgi:glutathione S-transferase
MTRPVTLYDLAASPNNIKVRLALAYKNIPYEKIQVDMEDRRPLVKVSGQPLAPVLVHGDTVVFDSYAIVRYLDANWPSPPRLFSAEREAMKQIEEWEQFARTEASQPIRLTFNQAFAPSPDAAALAKANGLMNRAASRIEEALAKTPCLMGEAPNAADFTLASMLYYGAVPEGIEKTNPIAAFFRRYIKIEKAPKTLDWIARMMAWDKPPKG